MDYPGKVITKTQVTPTQTSASGNWTLDDQAAAIKNNNWPVALVPNPISKSLRFNSADSAYLNRTPASAGNRRTWTWSGWVKMSDFGTARRLFSARVALTGSQTFIQAASDNTLLIGGNSGAYEFRTTAVYRDPSAWYHIVLAFDTTQATSSNRVKLYVNGLQVTAFQTATYPSQNTDTFVNATNPHSLGAETGTPSEFLNGYMTEINFIDGQALTPSDFGLTNPQTGQWIPKKYTGTYGTNGFYLNFKDATSTTTLGYDYSGNANNWTTNNFSVTAGSGNDSLTDVPTPWVAYNTTGDVGGVFRGNYCTLNSVKPVTNSITFSNGNLQYKPGSSWSTTTYVEGTIGVVGGSTGKYYWEMSADQTGAFWTAGVALQNNTIGGSNIGTTGSVMIYDNAKYVNGTSTSSYLTSLSANEVLGVALDAATGKVWFRDSGGWLGSGDPAAGTNETGIPTGFSGATLVPVTQANSVSTVTANFGQRPFAYTPPAGFLSLCTTNLPATTIGFGLTNQGDDYFTAYLYTADGTSPKSRTGIGFAPDFLWFKNRTSSFSHALYDTVRGTNKGLQTNTTAAENTYTLLTAFGSDGFTTSDDGTVGNLLNYSTDNYVTWAWKAAGSTVSNTAGTITSTVSANTTAGFSIVTYTGNGSANQTVGHGLGVAPAFGILKDRDPNSNNDQWQIFHTAAGDKYGYFTTATFAGTAEFYPTSGSSTTVTIARGSPAATTNESGDRYVMYLFAPVAGYSAFGSYTGNGSADGPFVYLGFRPRFVMVKEATVSARDWIILDSARNTYNVADLQLMPNKSDAEATTVLSSTAYLDFVSNGFKVRNTSVRNNESTATYIYAAFAESPFQFANAR